MADSVQLNREELLALVASAKELSSEIDLDDLLKKILGQCGELTNSPSASIFLDDPGRGLFAAEASGPKAADLLDKFGEQGAQRVPYVGSKAGEVFTSRESVTAADISSSAHYKAVDRQLHHHTESMVCVPLVVGDDCIGAMQILNKASGHYTASDVLLLEHYASHAALAIKNARLIRDLLAHKGLLTSPKSGLKTTDLIQVLKAEPTREDMTVLFADMRGFTKLVQSLGDPTPIVRHLNEFLDLLADQVLRHDGLVNKFLGDGILGLFRGRDTERRGASAAFDIIDAFDELKQKWVRQSNVVLDFVDVGVGIVTGTVIIGAIGSGRVRDFTAIGLLVNLAAAFESTARGGKRILADQATWNAIRDIAEADEADMYDLRKPDQPSGLLFRRFNIRRLKSAANKEISPDEVSARLKPYYHDSWAVVIGINEYMSPKISRLRYATSDVDEVAKMLPMLGFPEKNIQILKDEKATKNDIGRAIYIKTKGMTEEDRLLIFFAGHGEVTEGPGGDEGYLLPYDADQSELSTSSLPMVDFSRIGRRLPAKHILLVLDSCYAGFITSRSSATSAPDEPFNEELHKQRVVEVLTAGTRRQKAGEDRGNGLFTKAFVHGLKGAADPKGRGLSALKLATYIKERLQDTNQSPQIEKLEGEGEFLFLPPTRK